MDRSPGAVVVLALFALMLATVMAARRRGLSGRLTLRLLRAAGLVGLIGGPLAVAAQALARHWTTPAGYSYTPAAGPWETAALLGLLGCALLAVREILGRVGELTADLEGVI